MQIVLVFLSQCITDELVVGGALGVDHSLHQLHAKTSLETFYLLFFDINKTWGIPGQVVESMHIFSEGLGSLSELHELYNLHPHKP